MNIAETLPEIFTRSRTAIEPSTQLLLAMMLLSFQEIDALPIGFSRVRMTTSRSVVSGYSCLSKLARVSTEEYASFLEQPCESVSMELASVSAYDILGSLFDTFSETGFGFANVIDSAYNHFGSFASLRDLLPLYDKSIVKTDLTVGEVASYPVFSLPGDTTIKDSILEMVERRNRRVMIAETQRVISDRQLIDHIFSVAQMENNPAGPFALLSDKLMDLPSFEPILVSNATTIREAAQHFRLNKTCCLLCRNGMITPWDIVVKPWRKEKLEISA